MKQHNGTNHGLGRRGFLQIIASAGAAGALYHFGVRPRHFASYTIRQSRVMMGTHINLTVHGPDQNSCEDAVESTFTRMEELVAKLSRHDPESELSSLNTNGSLSNPSKDLYQVLLLANRISNITGGAFDVTVLPLLEIYGKAQKNYILPSAEEVKNRLHLVNYRNVEINDSSVALAQKGMAITLDGIGKGYIVDQGLESLRSKGFPNVYVEAGGDLIASGEKPGNLPWRIGIQNPRPDKAGRMTVLEISNIAVATSGDYMQTFTPDMRNHHIIDPRTGISPPELASATITAPTVALADALATAAMVMGVKKSLEVLDTMPGCEGFFIGKDLKQYQTPGFNS